MAASDIGKKRNKRQWEVFRKSEATKRAAAEIKLATPASPASPASTTSTSSSGVTTTVVKGHEGWKIDRGTQVKTFKPPKIEVPSAARGTHARRERTPVPGGAVSRQHGAAAPVKATSKPEIKHTPARTWTPVNVAAEVRKSIQQKKPLGWRAPMLAPNKTAPSETKSAPQQSTLDKKLKIAQIGAAGIAAILSASLLKRSAVDKETDAANKATAATATKKASQRAALSSLKPFDPKVKITSSGKVDPRTAKGTALKHAFEAVKRHGKPAKQRTMAEMLDHDVKQFEQKLDKHPKNITVGQLNEIEERRQKTERRISPLEEFEQNRRTSPRRADTKLPTASAPAQASPVTTPAPAKKTKAKAKAGKKTTALDKLIAANEKKMAELEAKLNKQVVTPNAPAPTIPKAPAKPKTHQVKVEDLDKDASKNTYKQARQAIASGQGVQEALNALPESGKKAAVLRTRLDDLLKTGVVPTQGAQPTQNPVHTPPIVASKSTLGDLLGEKPGVTQPKYATAQIKANKKKMADLEKKIAAGQKPAGKPAPSAPLPAAAPKTPEPKASSLDKLIESNDQKISDLQARYDKQVAAEKKVAVPMTSTPTTPSVTTPASSKLDEMLEKGQSTNTAASASTAVDKPKTNRQSARKTAQIDRAIQVSSGELSTPKQEIAAARELRSRANERTQMESSLKKAEKKFETVPARPTLQDKRSAAERFGATEADIAKVSRRFDMLDPSDADLRNMEEVLKNAPKDVTDAVKEIDKVQRSNLEKLRSHFSGQSRSAVQKSIARHLAKEQSKEKRFDKMFAPKEIAKARLDPRPKNMLIPQTATRKTATTGERSARGLHVEQQRRERITRRAMAGRGPGSTAHLPSSNLPMPHQPRNLGPQIAEESEVHRKSQLAKARRSGKADAKRYGNIPDLTKAHTDLGSGRGLSPRAGRPGYVELEPKPPVRAGGKNFDNQGLTVEEQWNKRMTAYEARHKKPAKPLTGPSIGSNVGNNIRTGSIKASVRSAIETSLRGPAGKVGLVGAVVLGSLVTADAAKAASLEKGTVNKTKAVAATVAPTAAIIGGWVAAGKAAAKGAAKLATSNSAALRLAGKGLGRLVPGAAVALTAWDVGKAVYGGVKMRQAQKAAAKEKAGSEAKYGSIEAATRTRKERSLKLAQAEFEKRRLIK